MTVVDVPQALPRQCIRCKNGGRDRVYIDTGVDEEFYGVIYICSKCFNAWRNELDGPDIDALKLEVTRLNTELREVTRDRDNLADAIRLTDRIAANANGQPSLPFGTDSEKSKRARPGFTDAEQPRSFS